MKCNWDKWTAIATTVMALGSVGALIFLRSEFIELRKANEIAVSIGRQSYRPLGVVRFSHEHPESITVIIAEGKTKDRFSLKCNEEIMNQGAGVLIYIGSLSCLSNSEQPFRKNFLNGAVDSVRLDGMYTYLRRSALMPKEKYSIPIVWENIPFSKQYFLYSLFLYEDQNGELYDTEHLDVLKFSDPQWKNGKLKPKLLEGSSYIEKYNYYSKEEKKKLIYVLTKLKSSVVGALSGVQTEKLEK